MYTFNDLDQWLNSRSTAPRRSLCPTRTEARSFGAIADDLAALFLSDTFEQVAAQQLKRIVQAQLENFPENIFWDYDYFVKAMLVDAINDNEPMGYLRRFGERVTFLMELFGEKSNIRFRYVHDFTYGFDWARWVRKLPALRQSSGPFSMTFLDYLYTRGHELLELIQRDDTKYHQLRDEKHRNPFAFSRNPDDETRLFTALAEDGLIPVPVWDVHGKAQWDQAFSALRKERALAMGITKS